MPDSDDNQIYSLEYLRKRSSHISGDTAKTSAFKWTVLSAIFLLCATSVFAYLFLGKFTRKFVATGYIVPERGVIKIESPQIGLLKFMHAHEGAKVGAGDPIAVINSEKTTTQGESFSRLAEKVNLKVLAFKGERSRILEIYRIQESDLRQRQINLSKEKYQADLAHSNQTERVKISESIFHQYEILKAAGFYSEIALKQKRQEYIGELANEANLARTSLGIAKDIQSVSSELKSLYQKKSNEISALDRNLLSAEQELIELQSKREIIITAPEAGTVTALIKDEGRQIQAAQPILSLLPDNSPLRADVYIPAKSIGFVHVGTTVLLRYHAFPYQKFGVFQGRIQEIAKAATLASDLPFPPPAGTDTATLFYVTHIALDQNYVLAYGEERKLQPGMGFDADLLLDTRTLIEWVFEPIFSISGRWH